MTYIEERKSGATTDRKDLLSRFFNIQKSHPGKFDDLDVQILATVNILAGSDTTSIALRAVLYYLMTNDRVCAKLLDELKTAEEQGTLSLKARYSEAQKLPYLQACIKEAMRLHPSLGTQHLRVVPEGGAIIAGKHLSSGVSVFESNERCNSLIDIPDRRWHQRVGDAQPKERVRRRCGTLSARKVVGRGQRGDGKALYERSCSIHQD